MVSAETVSKMIADDLGLQWKSGDGDTAWFEQRVVRLKPNPKLPEEIQDVLARDFPMEEGELRILVMRYRAICEDAVPTLDMVHLIPHWVPIEEETSHLKKATLSGRLIEPPFVKDLYCSDSLNQ